MSVEAKPSIHPPELDLLFRNPPLLLNELRSAYELLYKATESAMDPQNIMERLLVYDVVNLTWELVRAGRDKANLVNMTWKEATCMVLEALLAGDPDERRLIAQERADAFFTAEGRAWVVNCLAEHKLTIDAIAAQAMTLRLPELDIIDRQTERFRFSRMAIARDYTYHRVAGSWKGPKNLLAIVDAEAKAIALVPASDPAIGEP